MAYTHMTCEEEEAYKELLSMIESENTCLSIDHEYRNICEHLQPATQLLPEFTHSTTIHKKFKLFSSIDMLLWLVLPSVLLIELVNERRK